MSDERAITGERPLRGKDRQIYQLHELLAIKTAALKEAEREELQQAEIARDALLRAEGAAHAVACRPGRQLSGAAGGRAERVR